MLDPSLLGIFAPHTDTAEFVRHVGELWLVVGLAGIAFRVLQLFVLQGVQTGLVWATKIATDPFHDIKLYHRAPLELITGRHTPHATHLPDDEEDELVEEPVPASKPGL